MKRGPTVGKDDPITTAEVVGWFAQCRGKKPSVETCAEFACRMNAAPSPEWLAYSQELDAEPDETFFDQEYWDVAGISGALAELMGALPMIRNHWDRVADCEEALLARSALADLDCSLTAARHFIEHPFGLYTKTGYRKKPKEWHIPATIILDRVSVALATVKDGEVKVSRNSPTVKITRLILERMGYGQVTAGAIANYTERRNARFGRQ